MIALARRLDARFLAPLPAERLATLRVLSGAFALGYMLVRAQVLIDFRSFSPSRFAPAGLASVLREPLPQAWVVALYLLVLALGVAFTLGARFRASGPSFALGFLWVTSYRNSWGMIFHTDNLLAVHLLVLGFTPSAAALALDARGEPSPAEHARFAWPVRLLCAVTAMTYALAGIAKLKVSGLGWMEGEILRNYIAYDALRKAQVGSIHSPLGALLVQHAWPFRPIGLLTMLLELGAPLALSSARLGRVWATGIYGFHLGVLATMAIAFPYPLSGIAFASFFACEKLWRLRPLGPVHGWLTRGTLRNRAPIVR